MTESFKKVKIGEMLIFTFFPALGQCQRLQGARDGGVVVSAAGGVTPSELLVLQRHFILAFFIKDEAATRDGASGLRIISPQSVA